MTTITTFPYSISVPCYLNSSACSWPFAKTGSYLPRFTVSWTGINTESLTDTVRLACLVLPLSARHDAHDRSAQITIRDVGSSGPVLQVASGSTLPADLSFQSNSTAMWVQFDADAERTAGGFYLTIDQFCASSLPDQWRAVLTRLCSDQYISAVTPDSGTICGGETVTISGVNLANADVFLVEICGLQAPVLTQSPLTVATPAAVLKGTCTVDVYSTSRGLTRSQSKLWTYTGPSPLS
jgi:hypothetical protein